MRQPNPTRKTDVRPALDFCCYCAGRTRRISASRSSSDAFGSSARANAVWVSRSCLANHGSPAEAPLFKPIDLQGRVSSEVVAGLVPGASVVKAFNHLRAEVLTADPRAAGGRRVLFYSGDDSAAKAEVAAL